jgi:hypothetical protein
MITGFGYWSPLLCLGVVLVFSCTDKTSSTANVNPGGGDMNLGGNGGLDGGSGGAGVNDGDPNMSCGSHADCPAGSLCDPGTEQCRIGCQNDLDCGQDRYCTAAGFCEAVRSCTDSDSCSEGEACDCHQRCTPMMGRTCRTNLQCETQAYCDSCSGQCRERADQCGACSLDEACDPRAVCVGALVLGQEAASAPGYCARRCQGSCDVVGPGYVCEDVRPGVTACVPPDGQCASNAACSVDADCPPDRFCNQRMACQLGCSGDVGCPTGQVCQRLRCGPPCAATTDCQMGEECEDDGHCRIPGGCNTSADCLEPETHCDRNQSLCVPGCEVDNDCLDATQECLGTVCRPRGCSGNYQCAFGQVCNLESNMCEDASGNHCSPGCDPQTPDPPCGGTGSRCLSLEDREGNPVGDFCFEACELEPNECPKGYSCVELMDDMGAGMGNLCVRDCTLEIGP